MKYPKVLLFALAVSLGLIALALLSGCERRTVVYSSAGVPVVQSDLIGETQGCKIYEVDTRGLSASHLYLSKCDFDKSSSVTEQHTDGKTQKRTPNITVQGN